MEWLIYITVFTVSTVYCKAFVLPDGVFQASPNMDECQPIRGGCSHQDDCPIWFEPWSCTENETTCKCRDTNLGGIVHCNDNSPLLLVGYCMTSSCDNQSRTLYVGECPFSILQGSDISNVYSKLPPNSSELNNFTCGRLNRTGLLCSKCEGNLGTAMFSPLFQCIECSGNLSGWVLYTFLTLFPPTLFFIIVSLFQIRANSAAFTYFIFISQYISVIVAW